MGAVLWAPSSVLLEEGHFFFAWYAKHLGDRGNVGRAGANARRTSPKPDTGFATVPADQ